MNFVLRIFFKDYCFIIRKDIGSSFSEFVVVFPFAVFLG